MNLLEHVRHSSAWPLRRLGIDRGRALSNAKPGAVELLASRSEQLAYIRRAHSARTARPH